MHRAESQLAHDQTGRMSLYDEVKSLQDLQTLVDTDQRESDILEIQGSV